VLDTWQFISNDAWVPQVDWDAEWDELTLAAQDKFPFGMTVGALAGVPVGATGGLDPAPSAACQMGDARINNPGWNGTNDAQIVVAIDICDNAFHDWMRGTGRQFVIYISGLMMAFALYKLVVRSA
jgi:hypothetical protein